MLVDSPLDRKSKKVSEKRNTKILLEIKYSDNFNVLTKIGVHPRTATYF